MHGGNMYNKTQFTMQRNKMDRQAILDLYSKNVEKGKYWVADQ